MLGCSNWSLILKRKEMPEQNYAVATVPLTTPGDRWADGKLLGNATDSCTGATQRPLASPHWHSVPWGWNRAYSGVRFWRWWVSQGNWPSGSQDLMYPPRSAGAGFAFPSALALRMAVAR